MKKALHRSEKAFLFKKNGKVHPDEVNVEEIMAAMNRGILSGWQDASPEIIVLRKIHEWISRFIHEGATEGFCNDLNAHLHHVQYANYILPPDFYSSQETTPHSVYVANMDVSYSADTYAAREISRFVTYGILDRVRICQLASCERLFVGPPQAKWCSKTCGSKYRVTKKRKRDSK